MYTTKMYFDGMNNEYTFVPIEGDFYGYSDKGWDVRLPPEGMLFTRGDRYSTVNIVGAAKVDHAQFMLEFKDLERWVMINVNKIEKYNNIKFRVNKKFAEYLLLNNVCVRYYVENSNEPDCVLTRVYYFRIKKIGDFDVYDIMINTEYLTAETTVIE